MIDLPGIISALERNGYEGFFSIGLWNCRWRRSYTRRLCIDAGMPSFCEEPVALSLLTGTGLARRFAFRWVRGTQPRNEGIVKDL